MIMMDYLTQFIIGSFNPVEVINQKYIYSKQIGALTVKHLLLPGIN
jgi:hypothetical protein